MTLDLMAIEKEIALGRGTLLGGTLSSANSHIVKAPSVPEGKVFHKRYEESPPTKDAAQDTKIDDPGKFNEILYTLPALNNIDISVSKRTKAATEVIAALRWRDQGIPSQDVLHYDGDRTMIYRFLEGYSLGDVLNGDIVMPNEFEKVLNSFHAIRSIAKDREDPSLLHSDPFPDNFFYDTDRGVVVPSDSSKVNRADMAFGEVDARLNLFFLSKLFHIKTSRENQLAYLNQATNRLSGLYRRHIFNLYEDPTEQRTYFDSLSLPEDNVIDIYYKKDVRDHILESLIR